MWPSYLNPLTGKVVTIEEVVGEVAYGNSHNLKDTVGWVRCDESGGMS